MKTFLTILLVILLPQVVLSQLQYTGRPITVDSLPLDVETGDSVYFTDAEDTLWLDGTHLEVQDDVYWYINGFRITGVDTAFIDFTGKVLCDTSSSSFELCVYINRSVADPPDSIIVANGEYLRDNDGGPAGGDTCAFARVNTGLNIRFQDLKITIDGQEGIAFQSNYGGPGMTFYNVNVWCKSENFRDRQYFEQGFATFNRDNESFPLTDTGMYHARVESCTLHVSPHAGINVGEDVRVLIADCSLHVDAYNEQFDTLPCFALGTCPQFQSSDNPYVVRFSGSAPGCKLLRTTLTSGSTHGGSRGLLIENVLATSDNPTYCSSVTAWTSNGPSGENVNGWSRACRIRTIDNHDIDNIRIVDSRFVCYTDNSGATSGIGSRGVALNISWDDDTGPDTIDIVRSQFICSVLTTGVTDANAFEFGMDDNATRGPHAWSIDSNYFESGHRVGYFGEVFNIITSRRYTLTADTFNLDGTWTAGTFHFGEDYGTNELLAINDCAFQNSASDGDLLFHSSTPDNSVDFTVNYTMGVTVLGADEFPVEGATVKAGDSQGDTTTLGTTDENGQVSYLLPRALFEYTTLPESTVYNSYNVFAYLGDDTTEWTTNLTWNNKDTTITLSGTSGSWGCATCEPSEAISISSLPYTISLSDTCYILSGNLDAGSNDGIVINSDRVTLYLGGYNLNYGDGSTGGYIGIEIGSSADSVFVDGQGGAIICDGDATAVGNHGFYAYGVDGIRNIHLHDVDITVVGQDVTAVTMVGLYYFKLTNCDIWQKSRRYTSRCTYNSVAVATGGMSATIPGSDGYHFYAANNTIHETHHSGFLCYGVVKLIDNTVTVDAVNEMYPTGGNDCWNASNSYGFNFQRVEHQASSGHYSEIHGNVCYSGTDWFGSDGMFEFEGLAQGTVDSPLVFNNNKSYMSRGWDPEFNLYVRGIAKIRPNIGPPYFKYVHFKYDSCWVYSRDELDAITDSASQWSAYGKASTGFYLIASEEDVGNVIESCYVWSIALLDTNDASYNINSSFSTGFSICGTWTDSGWTIRDNVFESNHTAFEPHTWDYSPTDGWDSIYNNTFNFIDTAGADREYLIFIAPEGQGWAGVEVLDAYINPDSIRWGSIDDYHELGTQTGSVKLKQTIRINVIDGDYSVVPGCSVFVWNGYGDTTDVGDVVAKGITDGSGNFAPVVTIGYWSSGTDSLNSSFNEFTIRAVNASTSDTVSDTLSLSPYYIDEQLQLSGTSGPASVMLRIKGIRP